MPFVSFKDLIADAEKGNYAVGYFESWNMESLQAVADAAEATRSPVMLGFSGIRMDNPDRVVNEYLSLYSSIGVEACRKISVPACLIFNESSNLDTVLEAIGLGFGIVMFTDDGLSLEDQMKLVRQVVNKAHLASVAVEGELASPPGIGGDLSSIPDELLLTDLSQARMFVENTGVDALAVNIGQAHLHGRGEIRLDFSRLAELRKAISIPLVLHGASSIRQTDLKEAINLGIRKINVGSILKRSYFEALRCACAKVGENYNPYEVIGSGLDSDVLVTGRIALQKVTEDMMRLFGSAGKA